MPRRLGVIILEKCISFWHSHIHFIELHYLYILALCFLVTGLLYCEPGTDWKFEDALFMGTTAVTNTGLNTVDMSRLSRYQLVLMFFASIFGSPVMVSIFVVFVRKHYFSKRFEDVLLYNRARQLREDYHRRKCINNIINGGGGGGLQQQEKLSTTPSVDHQQRQQANPVSRTRRNTMPVLVDSTISLEHRRAPSFRSVRSTATNATSTTLKDLLLRRKQTTKADNDNDEYGDHERSPSISINIEEVQGDLVATQIPSLLQPPPPAASAWYHEHGNNIEFADNIAQQRQQARRQLEQERKYDELLQRIASASKRDWDEKSWRSAQDTDNYDYEGRREQQQQWKYEDEDDEEEIKSIMRQPIYSHELTRRQRYRIGGAEYRALDFLSRAVPIIYFTVLLTFAFGFRIYIATSKYAQDVLRTSNDSGPVDPWIFSFFVTISSLNNMGLSPVAASMVPFKNAPAPLLMSALLIILGLTGWAVMLRFVVWCLYKLSPETHAMRRETLRYLLDHPRRCYYSMFPSSQTWWLVFVIVIIHLAETVVFLATNYYLPVMDGISWGSRILIAFFQGAATRAGFSAISLMEVNPATQLVYIVAMYLNVYPVVISIRNSNIYQERALGIYSVPVDPDGGDANTANTGDGYKLRRFSTNNSIFSTPKRLLPKRPGFYVMMQVQRQLANEIVWLIAGIFVVCVVEAKTIMAPAPVTVLSVMYECTSAFGNAGSSMGFPNITMSQSAIYQPLSKLVVILLMYRGRHRGLPSAIDHAVLLPSEQLEKKDELEQSYRQRQQAEMSQMLDDYPRWRTTTSSTRSIV